MSCSTCVSTFTQDIFKKCCFFKLFKRIYIYIIIGEADKVDTLDTIDSNDNHDQHMLAQPIADVEEIPKTDTEIIFNIV